MYTLYHVLIYLPGCSPGKWSDLALTSQCQDPSSWEPNNMKAWTSKNSLHSRAPELHLLLKPLYSASKSQTHLFGLWSSLDSAPLLSMPATGSTPATRAPLRQPTAISLKVIPSDFPLTAPYHASHHSPLRWLASKIPTLSCFLHSTTHASQSFPLQPPNYNSQIQSHRHQDPPQTK